MVEAVYAMQEKLLVKDFLGPYVHAARAWQESESPTAVWLLPTIEFIAHGGLPQGVGGALCRTERNCHTGQCNQENNLSDQNSSACAQKAVTKVGRLRMRRSALRA